MNTNDIYSSFGANERAIIDKIKNNTLRSIIIRLIALKLRLQWTAWLQYLILIPAILIIFLLSLIIYLFGGLYLSYAFSSIGILLSIKLLFDIIVVKYNFQFPESKPKRNDDLDIFDLMRIRHSCRSYQSKMIEEKDLLELNESINSRLSEPKFSSQQIRFEYISTPIKVWPVVNAKEFLVAIAPKEYDRLSVLDVGRTLQKIVIDATRIGIGTCWIGPGADHNSITSELAEKFNSNKDNIICVCAIGYESKHAPLFIKIFGHQMRKRLPINTLFFNNYEMNEAIDINHNPYNMFQRSYEACQYGPSSYNGQTTRAIVISENNKVNRIDFLATTSSKYYAAIASGIWCANWELGCEELNLRGEFKKLNDVETKLADTQKDKEIPIYDMSWVLKN